jgi:hypothetical protein
LWQQGLSDWAAVACAGRAVADIAADGDPYTGVDVYDSTTNPQGNKGWAIVGGTSVASPIIASIFALAGGAHGVQYPARTLYENAAGAPAGLHDVSAGSNGECTHPFNESTGTSGCTSAEQAASCSASAICLAGAGYDGPSGVGTPNGIGAFEPTGREGGVLGGGGAPEKREQATGPGGASAASTGNGGLPPAPTPAAPATPTVSALALTRSALIALNRAHPKVSRVGFSFVLSVPTRVTASLARWARVHRHRRWKQAAPALVFTAAAGRQSAHLAGRRGLPPGEYRLTVSPAQGAPAAIVFQIG